ncbi:arsenic resistance N-acetyltransferase ArsN2 [Pseudomonas benzenivorans]|uniref:GNAT family N-acetyltransferase n=1 Tax=Pseudomonas benzenivorans TaxID=556533 RepID=A0ABY5H3S7_9PSED|nr:arsenic resistance N-acetyltransferase ArsN2 [Pseudomonas benzenivorans]UTW06958.1 GNAT family N-acetyltransferase [Pseudomonas benzenivorans]
MTPPIAPIDELDDILALLRACDLPVADIAPGPAQQFFGLRDGLGLIGVVGLETMGAVGLLRSVAVAPAYRSQGLAAQLVAFGEARARAQGAEQLFLLTTSAADYFIRLGYRPMEKSKAPPAVQATAQFAGLCPASSVLLCKALGRPAADSSK